MARIGLATGGGDCPGLNAVIRAVVKRAAQSQHSVVGLSHGFGGLFSANGVRELALDDISGILPRGGTILGTSNRSNPFSYPVKEGEALLERDLSDQAVARMRELGLDGLIMVGGDGSLQIARQLSEKGLRVIGVPKTIDNDLAGTDQTFGFDSARNVAMRAVDMLHSTAEAHDRLMVLEVMGRDSGFIALEAGVAGGADIILMPEIPYHLEPVIAAVQARQARGRSFSIAVVAEGAYPAGGGQAVEEAQVWGRGTVRLGGAGRVLAERLAGRIDLEVRVTVLGHLQRGGSPSAFDRLLCTRLGAHAITLVDEGRWNRVAVLRGTDITDVPLSEEATATRRVNPHGQLVTTARQLGITFGD